MNNTFDTGSMAEEGDQGCFSVLSLMAPGELMLLFNQYVKGTSRKKNSIGIVTFDKHHYFMGIRRTPRWCKHRHSDYSSCIYVKERLAFLVARSSALCQREQRGRRTEAEHEIFVSLSTDSFFQKSSSFHKEPFLYKDLVCVSVYVCVNSYEYVLFVVEV